MVAAAGLRAGGRCRFALAPAAGARAERWPRSFSFARACHGEDGNSKMEKIPSLAGQPAFFILNQLFLMREGVRKVEAMAPIVKDLKDDDLNSLSQHFAKLPAKRSDEPIDPALAKRGAEIAAQRRCGSCHLPSLAGQEQMPRRGQAAHRLSDRDAEILPRQPASRRRYRDERRHRRRERRRHYRARALRGVAVSAQSQNANVRVSMLSRGGAFGGVSGSSNARVRGEARRHALVGVEHLEHQRLVALHLREVEPLVRRIVGDVVDLAGAVLVAPLHQDEALSAECCGRRRCRADRSSPCRGSAATPG